MQCVRDVRTDAPPDILERSKCCNCLQVETKNEMGVARLCRCLANIKSAEDILKQIFCVDIIVRGEHVEKCGLSPAPRTEERVFEGVLFQNRDEVGFISNNSAGLVEEVEKPCVPWKKWTLAVLEHHYLDTSQEWKESIQRTSADSVS